MRLHFSSFITVALILSLSVTPAAPRAAPLHLPAPAENDSLPVHINEPVTVTVIATIAAVTGIIAAGYGLYTWATDNLTKGVVGQVCYLPDGRPNNAWTKEDSGLDWASTVLKLKDVADDPCGEATAICWADAVWGDETSNDVWVSVYATPEACSGGPNDKNAVASSGRAKADDFEVVTQPVPGLVPPGTDLVMRRTVEIDSMVFRASSFSGLGQGDHARAVFHAIFRYDGVPDTMFRAAVLWDSNGVQVSGDLTPADLDFAGYDPIEGWVVKILDFTFSDTVTFAAGSVPHTLAVPETIITTASVDADAAAEAPGQALTFAITELRTGQPGPDLSEYVEIRGRPGALLDSLTYVVVHDDMIGGRGTVLAAVPLFGRVMPADGYFLMAEQTFEVPMFAAVPDFMVPGPDPLPFHDTPATHLLVSHFQGGPGMDLDFDDDGRLDFRPWRGIQDCVSMGPASPTVATPGGYCGASVRSDPLEQMWRDCDGVAWHVGNPLPPLTDTPGRANPCPPPVAVEPRRVEGGWLAAPRPNPASGAVELGLRAPREARVRLAIVDISGRTVRVVADRTIAAGSWRFVWDGHSARGPAANGVYYAVLESGGIREVRPIVVFR